MKGFIKLIVLACVIAAAEACCKEQECGSMSQQDNKVIVTASFPEVTKLAISDEDAALDLSWEASDYLTIVSGTVAERYDMVSFSGKEATFAGRPLAGESYDIYLSRSENDYLNVSFQEQRQTAVASIDHLKYDAVLKGVSDYNEVRFSEDWAETHGGELLQNGCLLLYFQMPDDAGLLRTVTLSASEEVFYLTNTENGGKTDVMTLLLDDADMAADNVVRAHMMTSMQEASIPADTEFTLTVVSNLGTWSKSFDLEKSVVLGAGERSVIKLNSKGWKVPTGEGTEANPYILRTADDLKLMSSKLGTEMKYVAMVKDIDASSITTWANISQTKLLDFNGNNRTIYNFAPTTFNSSYAGFVGVLNGRIANLNMVGANVVGGSSAAGIVCGYLGQANANSYGELENVHVEESTINGYAKGVGGLVGILGSGKISRCSANVTVNSTKECVGGLVGYYRDGSAENICEISDCWTSGIVRGGAQKVGGIIGELYGNTTSSSQVDNLYTAKISNCYSTAEVEGVSVVAGIVAYAARSKDPTSVINCIAWNDRIEATGVVNTDPSSGAVVGRTFTKHTLRDCYRKQTLDFICEILNTEGEWLLNASVCDQENADSETKIAVGTYGQSGSDYKLNDCNDWYPYHGKTATATTVSSVARNLDWDESIWDFSGQLPRLKRL